MPSPTCYIRDTFEHLGLAELADADVATKIARFRGGWTADVMPALNEALANDELLDDAG